VAVLAALDGDASSAADVLAEMDFRPLEAYARLIAGERLREAGDDVAGEAQLERALRFYESVDAGAFASRARAALSPPQSESA
jgi:hypothetical protein